MYVEPSEVLAFLGRAQTPENVSLAQAHLPIVTMFVRAYVRGNGFDGSGPDADDLRAVIITATARLMVNPEQARHYQVADYSETPAVLNGFTLPELAVLHQYRRRTA
ncbi:MAG: hypothetical protein ACOX61_08290 [Brooklawnia sp.]|jgi:hypothetical protein